MPVACAPGELFFLTSAPAGSNVYACNPANVWTTTGTNLTISTGTANQVLSNNGSDKQWVTIGGDVSGTPGALIVNKLQGRSIGSAAPVDGQVLKWNAVRNNWEPAPGQTGNSSFAFSSQTSITIPGSVHQFGTANLITECYDGNAPPRRVEPDTVQIDPATYDVTVRFSAEQSGYCVVNGAGAAGAAGGGGAISLGGDLAGTTGAATVTGIRNRPVAATAPSDGQALLWSAATSSWKPANVAAGVGVASVFGRTGAVAAQTGDYSFSQISGTISGSQLPASINAANIGSGTVGNTAFGYLANVGSDLQAQLDSKAPLSGDLAGTSASATVAGIQNRAIANTAPSDGQALVWNQGASRWQPANVSAEDGATMASQLGDLAVVRTSSTVLTIGAKCSPSTPCNIRFGSQAFRISNSATATISGTGTGTAYIYAMSSGGLIVGHNLTVTCSYCTQQAATSFPVNVIPLYTWTATNGAWDSTGADQRALLSSKIIIGGQGIILTETPGQSTVAVDPGIVPTYLTNTATLSFPIVPAGGCSSDLTLAVPGANTGDAVAPGWPSGLPAAVLGIMLVTSPDTVSIRLCNFSSSTVQPPAAMYRATIVRNN